MQSPQLLGHSLDQIMRIVSYWEKQLRLSDWDISVEIADVRQMQDRGECIYDACQREPPQIRPSQL